MTKINHRIFTQLKSFSLFLMLNFVSALQIYGDGISDVQLLKTVNLALELRNTEVGDFNRSKAFRDAMSQFSDAERTRAIALKLFNLDELDGSWRPGFGSFGGDLLRADPSLIKDSSELKSMIGSEMNSRRFYLLYAMAGTFVHAKNEDFIPESAHMLFRNEPLAKTNIDSEYYNQSLTNASFFAYEVILRNLEALAADFTPSDKKLPYSEKIPILAKWLKANWPGCEDLEAPQTTTNQIARGDSTHKRPVVRNDSETSIDEQSSKESPVSNPWLLMLAMVVILVLAFGAWFRLRSS